MRLLEAINRFYYNTTLGELRRMNDDAPHLDITYNSVLYLNVIAYRENCTASFIAEALHISKPAVTAKVNELIRLGLVEKTQSETDKRVNHLSLTPKAAEIFRSYDDDFNTAAREIEATYTPEEIDLFCRILCRLSRNYREVTEHEEQ